MCAFLKLNASTQTSQRPPLMADHRNGNDIRADIVFYYSPGQSSGSFICTFKLFILSFVTQWPGSGLAGLLQASMLSVMYGTMISVHVHKIWIFLQDDIANVHRVM